MITRRTVVSVAVVSPLLVSVAPAFAQDGLLSSDSARLDGEVEMTLSSGLRRQTMKFGDQAWTETRDRLPIDEGQRVRLVLINDTSEAQLVRFAGPVFDNAHQVSVPAGARAHVEFEAAIVGEGAIVMGDAARTLVVRPSYFPHPMV